MTVKWPHISLIVGMLLVIVSLAFFGLDTNIYGLILMIGILISVISFCIVMIRKDSRKSKFLWLLIVCAGIILQWLSEPLLIRLSYVILIKQNEAPLTKVNAILLSKKGDATWVSDSSLWRRNNISKEEGSQIANLLADTRILTVSKDSSRIYYMTFSRIDITHGISYFYLSNKPENATHLIGNWYK